MYDKIAQWIHAVFSDKHDELTSSKDATVWRQMLILLANVDVVGELKSSHVSRTKSCTAIISSVFFHTECRNIFLPFFPSYTVKIVC